MKNITKTIIGVMFAFSILIGGTQAFAQEDTATLHGRILELRETHKSLKAQVEAGEITADEARETWKALLLELRKDKEAFFEEKIARVEAKYEQLKEKNPERAELFKEHLEAAKTRRAEAVEKRKELIDKVASGEVTRQQANKMRVEFVKDQRDKFQNIRENIKEKRVEFQKNRPNSVARPAGANTGAVPSTGLARPVADVLPNTDAVPLPLGVVNAQ